MSHWRILRNYHKQKAVEDAQKLWEENESEDVPFEVPVKLESRRDNSSRDGYHREIWQVSPHTYILSSKNGKWRQYWMEEQGKLVGFLNTLNHGNGDPHDVVLTAVEIRDGHQGQGKVGKMIDNVQKVSGRTLYTNGHCTPKGYAALKGKLPLTPDGEWEVQFENMNFVDTERKECWDLGLYRG